MKIALYWVIRLATVAITILAIFWTLMLLSAGLSLGFGERTNGQIASLLIFGLLLPTILTVGLAIKAITFSKRETFGRAGACLFGALIPIPMFYLIENWMLR